MIRFSGNKEESKECIGIIGEIYYRKNEDSKKEKFKIVNIDDSITTQSKCQNNKAKYMN
ncbi:hypothetical protein PBV87_00235 [Niameybacter massiliensis]|uniref:Uncharacterized protein n=1 Tax=Holtiella tumoricola TaxID=3018743 RepID=A0AA42DJ92_9FIRM|nr:hypothetical protein [Holtiella tumoricola]MDA3729940.1 hypothetical protein [Holtiella tumoricola]